MFTQKYLTYIFILGLSILFVGSPTYVNAQNEPLGKEEQKTSKKEEKEKRKEKRQKYLEMGHSPHRATVYAMVCPGLGQIYNKKYWKLPIVYGGFAVMGYYIVKNNNDYKDFRAAYNWSIVEDNPAPIPNEYAEKYTSTQLKNARDISRRNLDYSYIITGLWWALTVIDATVDAHLFEFEVSDNLSMKIEPDLKFMPEYTKPITGVKVSFKLSKTKQ